MSHRYYDYYDAEFSAPNIARDEAYEAGEDAFDASYQKPENPYVDPRLATDWDDGYETARMASEGRAELAKAGL